MNHQIQNYSNFVAKLAKPGHSIILELTPDAAHNLHMAVGIAGESGELLDAVKKQAIYGKPLDLENVIEELGDLEFYMQGLRDGLGITRDEVLLANIAKLSRRYPQASYSNQAAQDRADKS